MKIFYLLAALICLNFATAQNIKTLNRGKVVQKNYNVAVPYQDISGLAVVEAVINGKTYNFLVDTGAVSAISQQLYVELGLRLDGALDVDDSSDLRTNMKLVTLPPVHVGAITFKDIPAVVADNNTFLQCVGIDGFIGSNMLRNSVVKFSYKERTISFTDKLKNFKVEKNKAAELLKDKMQSNPYLYISLKNGGLTGTEPVLFDTGMIGLYDVSLSNYEQEFNKPQQLFSIINQAKGAFSLGINGVENPIEHYRLLMPELSFASARLENVTATTTSDNMSRIGSEMLKYGDVVIDYPGGKFYFNSYQNGVIDVAEKNWPVQPVIKGEKFVVGIVWDPVYNDRINEGDEVLRFGEVDYSIMHPCEIIKTGVKPKADTATMVLKDIKTGETKNVDLAKK